MVYTILSCWTVISVSPFDFSTCAGRTNPSSMTCSYTVTQTGKTWSYYWSGHTLRHAFDRHRPTIDSNFIGPDKLCKIQLRERPLPYAGYISVHLNGRTESGEYRGAWISLAVLKTLDGDYKLCDGILNAFPQDFDRCQCD